MNNATSFWKRWLCSTHHQDIGTLYLWFSLVMFFVGGGMALLLRAELAQPGMQLIDPEFFNQMFTFHGVVMVFGVAMPAAVGFANWQIPLMIGASDLAFPRLNNWSFWLLPIAFSMLVATLLMKGPAPDFGWTFYAPLSTTYGPASTDFMIFAIHLMGISSILGSINIIATILNMRTPEMTLMKMPMFVWTWLITAFLLLSVMPVLAGLVTMMLFDRHFGTSFFSAAGGGDPLLFQHIFWFFGHPEVYILILPAFGIISEIIPTFSRKPLFGYTCMVYATVSIAVVSFLVWAHHMFTTGMPAIGESIFMYLTMFVAVPTGVKVFNWVTTMIGGSITFETPMLFAIGFIAMFTIGGCSGVMLSLVPADFQYQDTYFVVGHFHYVLVSGVIFSLMAGVYYWMPKWTGCMYDERLGRWHFWLTLISTNITFFPMHFLGLAGMPRRIADYPLQFTDFNVICTAGSMLFGVSQLLFLYIIYKSVRGQGPKNLPAKIWEGGTTLEWSLPTPPSHHHD